MHLNNVKSELTVTRWPPGADVNLHWPAAQTRHLAFIMYIYEQNKQKTEEKESEVKGTTHPRPNRTEERPGEDEPPMSDPSGGEVTDEPSTEKRRKRRRVRERGGCMTWEVMGCRQRRVEEQPKKL